MIRTVGIYSSGDMRENKVESERRAKELILGERKY